MGNASSMAQYLKALLVFQPPLLDEPIVFVSALVIMLLSGNRVIQWLKNLPGMKWSAREDTPDTHLQKHGTPSMGGIGIISSALFAYFSVFIITDVLWALFYQRPGTGFSYMLALVILPSYTAAHMLLGWRDDWSKATGRGGMRARDKFLGQCVLAVIFVAIIAYVEHAQLWSGRTYNGVSTTNSLSPQSFEFWSFCIFVILALIFLVGTCNAVNITDGIDGLAAGLCVQVGIAFVVIAGFSSFSERLADTFWMALAGACLGFLFFNRYPARVFMGDTGSLALGAALGAGAILTHSVFLLPFIGFIFYVELLSVTTQVLYFKWTRKKTGEGKRLFRRAPLHHHFELGGWTERRVVATFWLVNLVTSAVGLLLWRQGILPRFP